jgi:hypothetical protein
MASKARAQDVPNPAEELYDGPDQPVAPDERAEEVLAPSISPRLLQLAADLDIADAKDMAPDRLEDLVHNLTRRAIRQSGRERLHQETQAVRDRIDNPPAPPAAPAEVDDLKELEADLDPRVIAALRKRDDEIKALKQGFGQVAKQNQEREERTVVDVIDNAFDSLNDDRFGQGAAREMDPSDLCRVRRQKILNAVLSDGLNVRTASAKKIAAAIRETVALLSPAPKAPSREPVEDSGYAVEDRPVRRAPAQDPVTKRFISREERLANEADEAYATVLARPTHRQERKYPPGDEAAVKVVSQLLPSMNGAGDDNRTGYVSRDDF